MKFRSAVSFATAVALACAAAPASAFTPSRSVDVVVHSGPGAGNDVFARAVVGVLDKIKLVPQSMQVVNKTGGGGIVAMSYMGEKKGDDHLLAVFTGVWWVNPMIRKQAKVTIRDLTPIVRLILEPAVMAVRADSPYKNAKELIEYAKANPGKVSFASSGNGAAAHLTTELLKSVTKTDMVHVPYKGAAPALVDLIGGQVQLFFDAASGLIQPGKDGKVRLIGVASDKRLPALPDLPTFQEQGIENFTGSTWAGMLAPAGTPQDIVKRMADEITAIVKLPDVQKRFEEQFGTFPAGGNPEEFGTFIANETKKWGDVIRTAGVKPD